MDVFHVRVINEVDHTHEAAAFLPITADNKVDARALHGWLGIGRDFSNWMRNLIADYGFEEGTDYSPDLAKSTGGRPRKDYHLTLDVAKEIAIGNTPKGKATRRTIELGGQPWFSGADILHILYGKTQGNAQHYAKLAADEKLKVKRINLSPRNMTNANLNTFAFRNLTLRTIELDGAPWFCGADVIACLGLSKGTGMHYKKLQGDEYATVKRIALGMAPGKPAAVVSESGLYTLIMRADKAEAVEFQNWVTREVLPAIRKTGGYLLTPLRWLLNSWSGFMPRAATSLPFDRQRALWSRIRRPEGGWRPRKCCRLNPNAKACRPKASSHSILRRKSMA